MRKWAYPEQGDGGDPVTVVMTDEEVLATYYPWWSGEMKRLKRDALISEQNCIDDWVVVHWAQEVK